MTQPHGLGGQRWKSKIEYLFTHGRMLIDKCIEVQETNKDP